MGLDQHFNYLKLAKARHYLTNPSCLFLATSTDPTIPDSKYSLPGSGSIVAAIQYASQRDPIVMGKPSRFAFEALQQVHPEIEPNRTLMVGDKILTDISFGLENGMKTLLVETGIDCGHDLDKYSESQHPHYIAASIGTLLP